MDLVHHGKSVFKLILHYGKLNRNHLYQVLGYIWQGLVSQEVNAKGCKGHCSAIQITQEIYFYWFDVLDMFSHFHNILQLH